MSVSRIALALALVFAPLPSLAQADTSNEEVVTTTSRAKLPTEAELAKAKAEAAAKPATPATTTPLTTEQQIALWHSHASEADPANEQAGDQIGPKRQIHGEAGVSIGTGGYRSAYATSLIPIGESGTLGIAISQTDFGKYGSPYMDYYGGGYGGLYGGRHGYGWNQRGGTSQSIALSLDMTGDSKNRSDTTCASGFRDGDRLIEPLWVTQMRGVRSCETTTVAPR